MPQARPSYVAVAVTRALREPRAREFVAIIKEIGAQRSPEVQLLWMHTHLVYSPQRTRATWDRSNRTCRAETFVSSMCGQAGSAEISARMSGPVPTDFHERPCIVIWEVTQTFDLVCVTFVTAGSQPRAYR